MYPVTQEFESKILAPIRKVYGKVQIDYTDPFLDQSVDIVTNEAANVSYPKQVADSLEKPIGKIFSLDGSCLLDGSYILAPTYEEHSTRQLGWWGSQLAGPLGVFTAPYPKLTANFINRPISNLKVVGDVARGEYPINFNIYLYGEAANLLYTETVVDNNQVDWNRVLIETIPQVTSMVLEISKWSHAGRQAKIIEFFTTIQEVYEEDEVISINLLEERETSQGGLPIGNISSNELEISLLNRNKKFDAGNIQSPLYNLIKMNRRIQAWLGIEREDLTKEFVPLGVFWSGDWSASSHDMKATTIGRDRLDALRHTTSILEPTLDSTLYDLAEAALQEAGLTAKEYYIDTALQNYTIPYTDLRGLSHRDILRLIAEACLGQVYCDRLGIIRVEGSEPISDQYVVTTSEQANVSYPNQVTDKIENTDALFFSLDGRSSLDGNYVLAPEEESLQMGWWSSQLSDNLGNFVAPYPTVTLNFNTKAVSSVLVVGDSMREEFPTEYIIKVYDAENTLLAQHATVNDKMSSSTSISENPTNATKITLEVTKWNLPNAQAKIAEFRDAVYKPTIGPESYYKKNNPSKYTEVANWIEVSYMVLDSIGEETGGGTVIVKNDLSVTENGLQKFQMPLNKLVQSEQAAIHIANKILGWFGDPRRDLELDWKGNPSILLGNVVKVVDALEVNEYRVIKQELEFAGYLRATLSGRKVVE